MVIQLDNGSKFTVPSTVKDILFQRFVDATTLEQALLKEEIFGYDTLIDILDCYFPDQDLINVEYDDVTKLGAKFLIPGDPFTTVTLYNHVVAVINHFKTNIKDWSIKHKGQTFYIASRKELYPSNKLTVGESLTMLELSRRIKKLIDRKGDADGNYEFSLGLEEIAILARKQGEMLPINPSDRLEFIKNRAEFFKDCPLSEILKVRFFFIHTSRVYMKTLDIKAFGKEWSSQPPEQKKKGKPKRKR